MASGRLVIDLVRAAARNRAVRAAAIPAATAAARRVGPLVGERYGQWRQQRTQRELAIKLARQLQGRFSEDTIIDGRPHVVVWKDRRPVQAFPPVEQLERRPELADFDHTLAKAPPPLSGIGPEEPRRLPWRRGRS